MYRIIDRRGTGKTKKLMLEAIKNNAMFVCKNPAAMYDKSLRYGIVGLRTCSYADVVLSPEAGEFDPASNKYAIDDLEEFLSYVLYNGSGNRNLIGYTLTNED